ncbi:unnamed protein product [Miscanthus lutarioriparius]|uniref:Late embryogenesis abundant protein LEA-2 subgroup domain-containing protein n=1 Tax=Miscanthus lutarioriparius TaxID=422564 RepID=A0A811SPP6_9POAL|nr:unnamed protein product [Miscanthus lutarioriparius]
MRADGDNDGKTSAFQCLTAARYTVAAVVTVLIVAVVVTSLKVVLRPESLRLSVVDGAVYSTPHPASEAVTMQLNLRADNPSGRARMYFLNVTAYLFDSATPATTPKPDEDCIIFFNPTDRAVRQEMAVDLMTSVEATNDPGVMNQTYFELLYNTKGWRRRHRRHDAAGGRQPRDGGQLQVQHDPPAGHLLLPAAPRRREQGRRGLHGQEGRDLHG